VKMTLVPSGDHSADRHAAGPRSTLSTHSCREPIHLDRIAPVEASHDAFPASGCHHGLVRPTLLIVDDHADFRAAARGLLEAEGFDVIGEAADGEEAIEAVARLLPQVVLLDVQLPGMDGLSVAEALAARPDPPAVVLISSRDPAAYGRRLRETSARGFIPKGELSGEAVAALVG
jgi:CheY-like chemotaxis protein